MRKRISLYAVIDALIVSLVFAIFLMNRAEPFLSAVSRYLYSFVLFLFLWVGISILSKKYNYHYINDLRVALRKIILSNLFVLGSATTMMFLVRVDYYSRTIVFGTIIIASFVELIWGTLDYYLRTALLEPPEVDTTTVKSRRQLLNNVFVPKRIQKRRKISKAKEEAILVEIDQEAFDFIFSYAPIESDETLLISTISRFNIDMQMKEEFSTIVNLKRINDIRYINKFFESANAKLANGGLFIDYVETKNLRKKRILNKFPFLLNYLAYMIDFMIKRIFPKFLLTKKIYFFLTRGQNRVFTKAETFGRLYSCGFEIVAEKLINKHLYFIARKVAEPIYPENPTYGPFIKLERVGYKGKMIRVFKLRTMHPYAEYLQKYIYATQGLQEGGKFKADFRVSNLGKFLRMFWLDELPMLVNLLKRELKIVGVRPLSSHYFSLYSKDLQQRRINYKPGLIPPFYADMPKTLEDIQASEMKYMDAYDIHPLRTDISYFFRAIFNIVFRRRRSQ